jgi:hypothetical protein
MHENMHSLYPLKVNGWWSPRETEPVADAFRARWMDIFVLDHDYLYEMQDVDGRPVCGHDHNKAFSTTLATSKM